MHLTPLPLDSTPQQREEQYRQVGERLKALLHGETDWVAAQATFACELHHAFDCTYGRPRALHVGSGLT